MLTSWLLALWSNLLFFCFVFFLQVSWIKWNSISSGRNIFSFIKAEQLVNKLHFFFMKKYRIMTLYLSVNVFSTKVLIGDTIFTSPTGDGDGNATLRGHHYIQRSHSVTCYYRSLTVRTISFTAHCKLSLLEGPPDRRSL